MKIQTSDIEMTHRHQFQSTQSQTLQFEMFLTPINQLEPNNQLQPFEQLNRQDLVPKANTLNFVSFFLRQMMSDHTTNDLFNELKQFAIPSNISMPSFNFSFQTATHLYEHEKLSYQCLGEVTTEDGRQANLSHDFFMEREFSQTLHQKGISSKALDPLVINLSEEVLDLTGDKFDFDLTSSAENEQLPYLPQSSAYLALDKNNDGTINNGSELFGPETGQGFDELSAYDLDSNGWIDEADPIFNELLLWQPQVGDYSNTSTLSSQKIGAICLTNEATPFAIKDDNNQTIAAITASSIVLNEDLQTSTIHQIDVHT